MAFSESALRREASRLGYRVHKSRDRTQHLNNRGGFQVVDSNGNYVLAGVNYDLTLEELATFLADRESAAV
jgi:hypothetical protein